MSANPFAIGVDIAQGIAKAGREQEIREQVKATQGSTGFEIFGADYKQVKTGDDMELQGYLQSSGKNF